MKDTLLYQKIESLPENMKSQVNDFVDFLMARMKKSTGSKRKKPEQRQFGSMKGLISMSPDFEAPLNDFKEYMLELS